MVPARSYCGCRYDCSSSIRSYVVRMHHHLVEVRSAKERERRRQTSFPFLCWTTMTFDDDPRDDDDAKQTVFEPYWVNQAQKSLLVRSFWSISQRPRPRGEPNRRSNVLKRLILTYLSKHGANIDVHASILYMCPPIGWFVIDVEFYGLQHVCFGVNQNGIV